MSRVDLLGIRIDAMTMDEAAAWIVSHASGKAPAVYVTKPYVEFLERAAAEPDIRTLLNAGALTLPDSVAVQWAAAYLGHGKPGIGGLIRSLLAIVSRSPWLSQPIPERFAGADFAWRMLEEAEAGGLRVYLIGHPKGASIDHTARSINKQLPKLKICGTFDGYVVNDREADLVADLGRKAPDLILVGIGFPRQEELMSRLVGRLDHGVFVGEGGTFDYESFGGRTKRAPEWLRRIGLEWAWRLMLEPARLHRQLAIPKWIKRVYQTKNP